MGSERDVKPNDRFVSAWMRVRNTGYGGAEQAGLTYAQWREIVQELVDSAREAVRSDKNIELDALMRELDDLRIAIVLAAHQ